MIERNHALPVTRQAELVGISRGNVYYLARAASEADQRLMKRIDALNLAHPFMGSRMLRDMLNREGFEVGRRHVTTLMQRMGIEALCTGSTRRATGGAMLLALIYLTEMVRFVSFGHAQSLPMAFQVKDSKPLSIRLSNVCLQRMQS